MTTVIAITSGKAEVGKSVLSANLARYLNQNGHRTGLLTAGANHSVWGIAPSTRWTDILHGRLPVDKAIHQDVFGIDLMVAKGNGHCLRDLSGRAGEHLNDPRGLLDAFEYLIVDICQGISASAMACCLTATENLMVLTPDTITISGTYDWLSLLARHGFSGPVNLVLNKVRKPALAQSIYIRFKELLQKRLKLKTNLWGTMNLEKITDSVVPIQQPLSLAMSHSQLLQDIHTIGDRLIAEQPPGNQIRPLKSYLQDFLNCQQQLPEPTAAGADRLQAVASTGPAVTIPSACEEEPAPNGTCKVPEVNTAFPAQLETILTTIARELNAIRNLLESRPFANPAFLRQDDTSPTGETSLNFDAYIKSHRYDEEQ